MNETKWYNLDNVAFYYASIKNKKRQTVFRFSCELKDNIDKDYLQIALKETIKEYPNFHVTLKRGFFWYYLEESFKDIKVEKENKPICHKIIYDDHDLLYDVTYYKNRINLEMSHVLSDGRGALEFFKLLVSNYVKYNYKKNVKIDNNSSEMDRIEDSYDKYFKKPTEQKTHNKNIYHYNVPKLRDKTRFYEIHTDLNKVLKLAHKYNTSLTGYLVSILIYSILKEYKVSDYDKLIKIEIPVDLRGFYNSNSLKNFFGLIAIDFRPSKGNLEFDNIVKVVNEEMKDRLTIEALESRTNKMVSFQKLIAARMLPLFIKEIGMCIINNFTSKMRTTNLSNVGSVKFDKETDKYVKSVIALTSTNDFQFTVASNKNDLCIGVSSIYKYNNIIRNYVRYLKENGVDININTEVI